MEPINFIQLKTPLIVFAVLSSVFIIIQIFIVASANSTSSQKYEVLESLGGIELRYYPTVTLATITSSAKTYRQLGNSGFSKLAKYIFGGNDGNKQIAMMTPVHMQINDQNASMSFVMPSQYSDVNFPQPYDSSVLIQTMAGEHVAAIQFAGFASEKMILFYTKKLQQALQKSSVSYYGNFRFLGYNPPYQLVNRRNEIIISINWDDRKPGFRIKHR